MSDFRTDIWRLQAQLDIQGLIDALADKDAGIRKRAAAALRTLGAIESIPVLTKTLDTEPDSDTRAHILASIESLQEEAEKRRTEQQRVTNEQVTKDEALNRLISELKSDNAEIVAKAAKELAELQDKQAVEPLVLLFKDTTVSIKVRLAVAEALLKLESAPVEVALLGALRSPEWRVRRNAAAILGQLKADWAVEPLSKALQDENELVRRTAYAALRYIGTPEAQQAVKDAVERAKKRRTAKLVSPTTTESPKPVSPRGGLRTRVQTTTTSPNVSPDNVPLDEKSVESPHSASQDSIPDNNSGNTESDLSVGDDKISWPKRDMESSTLAPTKPLNPDVLDEAKARFERMKNEQQKDDT